jgi:hypothetical protein
VRRNAAANGRCLRIGCDLDVWPIGMHSEVQCKGGKACYAADLRIDRN